VVVAVAEKVGEKKPVYALIVMQDLGREIKQPQEGRSDKDCKTRPPPGV
jgi:hypothetical protein